MTSSKRSDIPRLFFSNDELAHIGDAIASAETNTSGEIRVRIERNCPGDPLDRAKALMPELGITATKDRTGVLIYISLQNHRFAIFGDEGIHKVLENRGWEELSMQLSEYFKKGEFCEGLVNTINKIGEVLSKSFPAAAVNVNEITDEPSFEE